MSFKTKITKIVDSEARSILNTYYVLNSTKANNNSGVRNGTVDSFDARTGLLTIKYSDGTTETGVSPGSAPVGPGVAGVNVGGIFIY